MNEFMVEQLVKKKTTAKDTLIKVVLIAGTVISFLFFSVNMIAFLLFVVFLVLDVFLLKRLDVEYEYAYFDGTLDIAKIMSKQYRKEVFSTNIKEEMEILAPTDSPDLKYYNVEKTLDYTTKYPEKKTYTMVTLYKGQKVKVIFEPNEKMLNSMRDAAPRKVNF